MIKQFFIDDHNRFVFNTKFKEADKEQLVTDFGNISELELAVLKNNLLDIVEMLCSHKKSIVNITVQSEGFIKTEDGVHHPMVAVFYVEEGEAFELYGYVADFNIWLPMREYMPYDLIDFLTEFKKS